MILRKENITLKDTKFGDKFQRASKSSVKTSSFGFQIYPRASATATLDRSELNLNWNPYPASEELQWNPVVFFNKSVIINRVFIQPLHVNWCKCIKNM
jgi:hypothetical protein